MGLTAKHRKNDLSVPQMGTGFWKDGLDLLLWIMILLILHDSIASWAGAAKVTTAHQVTTVTLQDFYEEKLENSGKTKTPKGDKYEE